MCFLKGINNGWEIRMKIDDIIRILNLEKHPEEGGFFKETFRSSETLMKRDEPNEPGKKRSLNTAIYYFLTPDTCSRIHRLKTDEIFHFYLGDPVEMIQLYPDSSGKIFKIGNDIFNGFVPQILVPKKVWQGCRLITGGRFALMGTTMSPGFDYSDYEPGKREILIQQYREFKEIITYLTR